MLKRMISALLAAICLWSIAAAQEPVYAGNRDFAVLLRQAGISYEVYGVDEDGDDSISFDVEGFTVNCFLDRSGEEASILVWYLIEYDPSDAEAVMLDCSRLNRDSAGPCFYADESDCTVTISYDIMFPAEAAGEMLMRGSRIVADMLPEAKLVLSPYDISRADQSTATPAPVIAPAATPVPAATAPVPSSVVITAEIARVRGGPSVTSPYLCTAYRGETFYCIGVSGNWFIIDVNGRVGFVSMESAQSQ